MGYYSRKLKMPFQEVLNRIDRLKNKTDEKTKTYWDKKVLQKKERHQPVQHITGLQKSNSERRPLEICIDFTVIKYFDPRGQYYSLHLQPQ